MKNNKKTQNYIDHIHIDEKNWAHLVAVDEQQLTHLAQGAENEILAINNQEKVLRRPVRGKPSKYPHKTEFLRDAVFDRPTKGKWTTNRLLNNQGLSTAQKPALIPEYLHLGTHDYIDPQSRAIFNKAKYDLKKYFSKLQPADEIYRFYWELLEQLRFLHQHQIGLGDIKPANILIFEGEDGRLHPVFSDLDGCVQIDINEQQNAADGLTFTSKYLPPSEFLTVCLPEEHSATPFFNKGNIIKLNYYQRDSYALYFTMMQGLERQLELLKNKQAILQEQQEKKLQDIKKLQALYNHCKRCAGITDSQQIIDQLTGIDKQKDIKKIDIKNKNDSDKIDYSFQQINVHDQNKKILVSKKIDEIKNTTPILKATELFDFNQNNRVKNTQDDLDLKLKLRDNSKRNADHSKDDLALLSPNARLEEAQAFIAQLELQYGYGSRTQNKDNTINKDHNKKFRISPDQAVFSTGAVPVGPTSDNMINEMQSQGYGYFYRVWQDFEKQYNLLAAIYNKTLTEKANQQLSENMLTLSENMDNFQIIHHLKKELLWEFTRREDECLSRNIKDLEVKNFRRFSASFIESITGSKPNSYRIDDLAEDARGNIKLKVKILEKYSLKLLYQTLKNNPSMPYHDQIIINVSQSIKRKYEKKLLGLWWHASSREKWFLKQAKKIEKKIQAQQFVKAIADSANAEKIKPPENINQDNNNLELADPNQVKIELRKSMIKSVLKFLDQKLAYYDKNRATISQEDKKIAGDLVVLKMVITNQTTVQTIYEDDSQFNTLAAKIIHHFTTQHAHKNNNNQKFVNVSEPHDLNTIKTELCQDLAAQPEITQFIDNDNFLKDHFGQNINHQKIINN